jgi:hypothetical protein
MQGLGIMEKPKTVMTALDACLHDLQVMTDHLDSLESRIGMPSRPPCDADVPLPPDARNWAAKHSQCLIGMAGNISDVITTINKRLVSVLETL